jgi:hypothetical protein
MVDLQLWFFMHQGSMLCIIFLLLKTVVFQIEYLNGFIMTQIFYCNWCGRSYQGHIRSWVLSESLLATYVHAYIPMYQGCQLKIICNAFHLTIHNQYLFTSPFRKKIEEPENVSKFIEIYLNLLKFVEMHRNVSTCIKMRRNVSKCIEMHLNVLKCI